MFQIEHKTAHQWEPVNDGEFETEEDARAALVELEKKLGWTGLRVVEVTEK